MFKRIKIFFKGVINKVFNRDTIEKRFDIVIDENNQMMDSIETWSNMYQGVSPWLDANVKDLGLATSIAGELSRLVTLEFESEILNNECLNMHYQEFIANLKIYCEYACAKGAIVFKPFVESGCINIDVVQADKFYPVAFNSRGDIDSAIFIETKTVKDKIYTRVEYHYFEGNKYIIKNVAYEKNSTSGTEDYLGKEVPLDYIDDWKELSEKVVIKNIDKPLFSYFKIPVANNIDDTSPLGVSVYSKAINLIKEADKQYSRILWEYEAKETAVHIAESLFRKDVDTGKLKVPEGKERLYRQLDIDTGISAKNLIDIYSPEIRDTSLYNGLNQILRRIEFNCGLAYGTLSDINETDKTATEIKASKQRSYSTVKCIQKSLENALKNLVYSMWVLAKLYKLPCKNIDIENDITYSWDDSVIVDKDTEFINMFNDVAANILRPEIYISKKYNVSEEEALEMMPKPNLPPKSPMDRFEE